mmetsp:Transcript_23775/g.75291  ORF Transcript_23775/g.75291 Transcript_23775/m.75291 type:complete len:220 (-) Transcript_23775:221-880(-)
MRARRRARACTRRRPPRRRRAVRRRTPSHGSLRRGPNTGGRRGRLPRAPRPQPQARAPAPWSRTQVEGRRAARARSGPARPARWPACRAHPSRARAVQKGPPQQPPRAAAPRAAARQRARGRGTMASATPRRYRLAAAASRPTAGRPHRRSTPFGSPARPQPAQTRERRSVGPRAESRWRRERPEAARRAPRTVPERLTQTLASSALVAPTAGPLRDRT